ncbi:ubiquitin-like protein Pup [Ferrimicrobium acidiphilum]|jgi:uncharacterized protein YejL (UPF0352 family)|nr:ubiquitin-like protein Pup [Ferrimicrobium acidiphilum]
MTQVCSESAKIDQILAEIDAVLEENEASSTNMR